MPFVDIAAKLSGDIPGLSPLQAESIVTAAWKDVCNARLWSFLMVDGAVVLPGQVTAGTVTFTQYASPFLVTLDAAASAAVTPFLSGNGPQLTQMQIRFNGGSLYSILSVNSAVPTARVLTLDRMVVEPGGSGIGYQIYRAYITAPASNFLRWESFNDFQNGYAIVKDRLSRSRMEFDARDPQRMSQGQAFFLGENKGVTTSAVFWEFWPHPTDGQIFIATYRSSGFDPDYTSATSAPAPIIPDSLVETRAKGWYAYQWAHANKGNFAALAKTDWVSLITDAKNQYTRQLLDVKRIDDEQAPQTVFNRGRGRSNINGLMGPADAAYWQSHPITW